MRRSGLATRDVAVGAAALMLIVAVAGCQAARADGDTVAGTLVRIGGPAPGSPIPLPGHVTATASDGKRVKTVRVGKDGGFHMTLAAGIYRLTGTSTQADHGHLICSADHDIHVLSALPVDGVEVICSIH
jgi:hypothetical protein